MPREQLMRRPRPRDRRPARLGHRPLQLPLPVLHARRGPAVARARRGPDASRRSSGSSRCSPSMGVRDVRLTGGEPLVRRDFPRAGRRCSRAIDGVDDLSVTTNGYLLERDAAALVDAGRRRASTSRSTRCSATASSRSRAATRCRRSCAGLEALAALPRGAPDQGQRRRDARLHRGRGAPVRRASPASTRTRCASSSSCRSTPTTPGRRTRCSPATRSAPIDRRGHPLEAEPREPQRDRARLPLRRRPRARSASSTRSRAVLRRLQPHPPDRRRQAAHLPVLARRDRPARAAARGRDRRRARADHPRRRLAQGAQAPRQRAGLRPAGADDERDRRLTAAAARDG